MSRKMSNECAKLNIWENGKRICIKNEQHCTTQLIIFCRVPYTEKAHGSSFFLWKSRWFHKKIITLKSHWNYSWDLSDKIKFSFRFIFQRLNKVYSFAKSIGEWPSVNMLTIFWNDIAEWVATIIFKPKWN